MSSTRKIESFYTDGACSGNPGAGGWGVLVYFTDGSVFEIGGANEQTTNNRMEMQAAIAALKILASSDQTEPVTLYSDSEYVIKGATKWLKGWQRKGWKTAKGKPVLNQDLWQTLAKFNSSLVQWQHVRGHSGNEGNERCDEIARAYASGIEPKLKQVNFLNMEEIFLKSPELPVTGLSDLKSEQNIVYKDKQPKILQSKTVMIESTAPVIDELSLSREDRVNALRNLIDTLRIADEIASKGYLISSSELADLMDINASAVTSRGDHWPWRNWVVSRVRREGNQILWQLERVD